MRIDELNDRWALITPEEWAEYYDHAYELEKGLSSTIFEYLLCKPELKQLIALTPPQLRYSKRTIHLDDDNCTQYLLDIGFTFSFMTYMFMMNDENRDTIIKHIHLKKSDIIAEVKEKLSYLLRIKPKYAFLKDILQKLDIDLDEILDEFQGIVPQPIEGNPRIYKSGRGKVSPHRVKALGYKQFPRIPDLKPLILDSFTYDSSCVCMNNEWGFYVDAYIPVIRYGSSEYTGYYHEDTEIKDAEFTWYYVEPESGVYLHANKVYVGKNKFTVLYELEEWLKQPFDEDLKNLLEVFKHYAEVTEIDYDLLLRALLGQKRGMINDSVDNYLFDYGIKKYYYDKGEDDYYDWSEWNFDDLDEHIWECARKLGIEVVIMTHQNAASGRLVTEALDTRKRIVSYNNLYTYN